MKGSLCIIVLAAALQVAVLQESEPECPNPTPAECAGSNVCENSNCPRYTSTKCCVELVDSECVAQFYRLPKLNLVTDKCFQGIDSCLTKECSERRTCMEEIVECREDKPDCGIQRVKAVCVLNEVARAPSNCDEIFCGEGTSCIVIENGSGTKVECTNIEPKSCEDLECDDGMQCVEREKPRCVPIRPDVRPSNCSQLECPESLVCMLLEGNRGARCAKPAIPTNCRELECDPGLVCEQVGNNERVRCVFAEPPPPRTLPPLPTAPADFTGELPTRRPPPPPIRIARRCDEIDCEDGYECKLVIDREINLNKQPVATCLPRECPLRRRARPPARCEEIRCERDEVCVLCGEGRETRARCMRRDAEDREDRVNMTRPMNGRDQDREDDRAIRRPPMLCAELVCGPEDTEKCQEFKFEDGRPQRALCIRFDSPDNCEEADCDKENETCIELENEEVKVARCVPAGMRPPRNDTRPGVTRAPPTGSPRTRPEVTRALPTRSPRTRPEGTRMPPTGGPRPTRPTMPDGPRPAQRCEELDCGRGFECLHVRRDDRRRAMCVRMRRNEMCRPAPPRPDGDRERPTGRPDRERPTGSPDRERPTGRPDRERPTGSPDRERPTGRPDRERPTGSPDRERPTGSPDRERLTGSPDRERPTGRPDGEKPTGSPERERPTGKPEDRVGTPDLDKKPTDSPMEGGNDGKDKEKRSVKSRPNGRDKNEDSQSEQSKSTSNSASVSVDPTASDEANQDEKSKSNTAGDDTKSKDSTASISDETGGTSKDLDLSGDSEASGEGTSTKSRRKGKDKMVGEQVNDGKDKEIEVELGEVDENGRPKKPESNVEEEEEVELDENGKLKKSEDESEIELDENGEPKRSDEDDESASTKEETTGEEEEVDENGDTKKEDDVEDNEEKKKEDELPLTRNARQAENVPLINILTAIHLPDLCMERRCCDGESCFVRRIAGDRPPLAFCAPDDFEGDRPPMPRPPTCEELMCEEGFACILDRNRDDDRRPGDNGDEGTGDGDDSEDSGDNDTGSGEVDGREDREDRRRDDDDDDRNRRRGRAVCVRRRPDRPDRPTEPTTRRPRPTRDPNRPRPTTGADRPRPTRDPGPTRGPRPTIGTSDRPRPTSDPNRPRPTRGPRPTRDPVRPTRPSISIEQPE